ncbi:hypothetical protein [Arthrobacter sp. 08Y14]|uniref:hypothetical protein n=1 Tax=Arthrobacter sp. 08Y14 TaxID=2058885 RepID=UPI0011B0CA3D|nr:hypothetical protein [Arthrobacter sp. 08Y14]
MSASSRSGDSLDPPPEMVMRLMERIVGEQWPSGLERFSSYFARLGCVLGSPAEPDDEAAPGVAQGRFDVPGCEVKNASWDALNDDLFSLNLFVYEGSENFSSADVIAGYDAVRDGISAVFGPSPDERTDRHGNRSAVWWVQGTVIELYAHVSVAPAVQVGAAHEGRTAVYHQLIAQLPKHLRH